MRVGVGLQRVHVEEAVAGKRDAGEDSVVERALQRVDVAGVARDRVEAAFEEDEADGGATLGVGVLAAQMPVVLEGLAAEGRGADAARDEHPPLRDAALQTKHGVEQPRVVRGVGHVRHAAGEVGRAHGVSVGIGLFADGGVGLDGRQAPLLPALLHEVVGLAAALVDEVLREAQVFGLTGGLRQLAEGELDFLVAGIAALLALAAAEDGGDGVRVAAHHVEEDARARGLVVGDGGLDEVAGAVEFVAVVEVRPALVRRDEREVAVEVAVWLLGGGDDGDIALERGLCGRVRTEMWGFQSMPGFQARRRASMACVSSQNFSEAGMVAARLACWRGASTGSARRMDSGEGARYFMTRGTVKVLEQMWGGCGAIQRMHGP